MSRRFPRRLGVVVAGALLVAAGACANASAPPRTARASSTNALSSPSSGPASTAPAAPATASGGAPASGRVTVSKVLLVVEENHSEDQVFPDGMPYLWSLARRYVRATAWSDVAHPSLPNYLAMLGGDPFGDPQDCAPGPGCSWSGPSVLGQALAHGRTVGVYEESMGSSCDPGFDGGYDVNHNPWVYFTDERAACARYDVPAGTASSGAFRSAVAAGLPTIALLVPDLDHDGHNGTLAAADAWLRQWLPAVLSGPDWVAGRLAVIVTFDEGETTELVPFVLMARDLRPATVTAPANHLALSRLLSDLAGGPALRAAATAPDVAATLGILALGIATPG